MYKSLLIYSYPKTGQFKDTEYQKIPLYKIYRWNIRSVYKTLRKKKRKRCYFYVYDLRYQTLLEPIKILCIISKATEKKIIDSKGKEIFLHWYQIFFTIAHLLIEGCYSIYLLIKVNIHLFILRKKPRIKKRNLKQMTYLRTDFLYSEQPGGSVGHTEGVVNAFHTLRIPISVYTSRKFKGIRSSINQTIIHMSRFFCDIPEVLFIFHTYHFVKKVKKRISSHSAFYQRYSLGNYSGVLLKKAYKAPFILEYNGSEIWVADNWGKKLFLRNLFEKIEHINLEWADVIIVVGDVLKEELIKRGIEENKILSYPNGVDIRKFNPNIPNNEIRNKYKIHNKTVLGFIGTFGQWHGVDILAKSVRQIVEKYPNVHYLIIGDGILRPNVEKIIKKMGVSKYVTLTGLIPQEDAPKYLAACDIFLSPHIPNPDGSKFFGSPTKIFEYMAMGRPIVASSLEQIGEILTHNKTALLCRPGDLNDFVKNISRIIEDVPLRKKIARFALDEVREKYTWEQNISHVLEKYRESIKTS